MAMDIKNTPDLFSIHHININTEVQIRSHKTAVRIILAGKI